MVSHVADGDLSGDSRKPGIRQNLPCGICVEDGYGWRGPVLRATGPINPGRSALYSAICDLAGLCGMARVRHAAMFPNQDARPTRTPMAGNMIEIIFQTCMFTWT